ncbi:hypothetical protein HPP92_028663, partial [Vanilla planifolia]
EQVRLKSIGQRAKLACGGCAAVATKLLLLRWSPSPISHDHVKAFSLVVLRSFALKQTSGRKELLPNNCFDVCMNDGRLWKISSGIVFKKCFLKYSFENRK